MKKVINLLLITLMASIIVGCGGGGGDDAAPPGGGGGTGTFSASFTADNPTPGADSVSMDQGSASGARVTIDVNITDTQDVFGGTFDVTYPSSMVNYVGQTDGNWNDSCGSNRSTTVTQPTPGQLSVVSQCLNPAGSVNVTGTRRFVSLIFDVTAVGSGSVSVSNAALQNDSNPPQDLGGITWDGGTIVGN